jgi:mannose-6-phosphate isomerase-like protein (cupin superfamily)
MATTNKKKVSAVDIRQVAQELLAWRDDNRVGATIFLGAGASISSGVPGWSAMAAEICTTNHLEVGEDDDPLAVVLEHLNDSRAPYSLRYSYLKPFLQAARPSRGYGHLAQLVGERLITTIVTTNWDPLVESVLAKSLEPHEYAVFVRGQLDDAHIAEALRWRGDQVSVVKLHGDLGARRFMLSTEETTPLEEPLLTELAERLSRLTLVVGQSAHDADVLHAILSRRKGGSLFHAQHGEPDAATGILEKVGAWRLGGTAPSVTAPDVLASLGDFDDLFTQLNLAVQLKRIDSDPKSLKNAERSILTKEEVGLGYINGTRVKDLISGMLSKVKKQTPDAVLFIDDPSAPGGMELKRRMGAALETEGIATGSIRVEGTGASRTHKRGVTSDLEALALADAERVLILDSITFSGNTLRIAQKALAAAYPHLSIRIGVLVVSQQLLERTDKNDFEDDILYQAITDRFEIFFPWGVTQTTGEFDRRFERTLGEDERIVHVSKRPWGAIEILANQEVTSVRLLTIEAKQKLSFQRHLCRDELFVALDDNIGLDICAESLPEEVEQYDARIQSLVLEKGDYVLIPRGVWHRSKASMDRVRLLEVAFGLYDQDADLQRRWDDFERQRLSGAT